MFKKFVAGLTAYLFTVSTVLAANQILEGNYIKVGVNETQGTLGSGSNTPPGILYDPTGTGTFNSAYDYLTPGSPFEGYSVKGVTSGGTVDFHYSNNNTGGYYGSGAGSVQVGSGVLTDKSGVAYNGTTYDNRAVWNGSSSDFTIEHDYFFNDSEEFLNIKTTITMSSAVDVLYFARYTDPDARAADGDSSATDNTLGYGAVPSTNVVFSEAISSKYALGLYSGADSGVNTAITSPWSGDAEVYAEGESSSKYSDGTAQGDDVIGIGFTSTSLSAGDTVTYEYAYIFGPSAFDAADTAVDAGAGGGTAGEVPGCESDCELVDVGSASEAASGPTVTGTGTLTVVNHSATDDSIIQTVDRTQTVSTWDIYSDGTTGTVSSSTTNLTPLTGRVDQHTELNKIVTVNRDMLLSDPYRQDGIQGQQGIFFINAHGSNFDMDNGYDANSQTGGIEYRSNINPGHVVGIMYNKTRTDLVGTDSESDLDQTQVSIYSHLQMGKNLLKTDVGVVNSQYEVTRSVGDTWNNQSTTNGTDTYLHTRLYVPYKWGMTPFVGYAFNQNLMDEYVETGDSVTARTVLKSETVDRAVEGGIKLDYSVNKWDFEGQLMRTSSDLNKQQLGIEYNFSDSKSVGVSVINSDYKDMSAQTVQFAVDINF